MVIQVYDDAGTIKSRVAIFTDKFVVTDGTSTGSPLVFEGSELKLQVARIATAIVEMLQTPSEKTQLGDFGGGAEGLRLFA
jgi:hypothetical protein